MDYKQVWENVKKIKENSPLVHNITNYVVMNNTANALLSIGASPVMAHAVEEVEDMVKIAGALVINIGTLSEKWIEAMKKAVIAADKKGIPIIIDPVGAGATPYRTDTCLEILKAASPAVIRGNASEIMALVNADIRTRGVDSTQSSDSALEAAHQLAASYDCIVSVSGETDLITDGKSDIRVYNGHKMMPCVTGLGCTATALTGAFCAVSGSVLESAAAAMAVMGVCGEIAVEKSSGPGSLQMNLIDIFYNITEEQIKSRLKIQ